MAVISGSDLVAVLPGVSESDAADLASAAAALVTTHLRGGACPEAVQDHAVIPVARFLHGTPGEAGGRVQVDGIESSAPGVGDAMHRSGAGQLLARYRGVRVKTARAGDD